MDPRSKGRKRISRVGGLGFADGPEVDDVVLAITGRGRVNIHLQTEASLGISRKASRRPLRPRPALVRALENRGGIPTRISRGVIGKQFHGRVNDLHSGWVWR